MDKDTQWIKVRKGTKIKNMPREISFCTHTIRNSAIMVIPDTTKDLRFITNPTVTSNPHIRFYAGAPLVISDGQRTGSLCVIDTQPHEHGNQQQLMLTMLSKQAIKSMELRISIEMLKKTRSISQVSKKSSNKPRFPSVPFLKAHQTFTFY